MHPVELQRHIDRELKSLPVLPAPDTLLPRVLAAVRHWADRPWHARAWFTWPMWWRVVVIAGTLRILWLAIAGPFVAYAFALLVLMGLLCAACAAALNRMAYGRTAHS